MTASVRFGGSTVTWSDGGWETDYEPDAARQASMAPLVFDRGPYEQVPS